MRTGQGNVLLGPVTSLADEVNSSPYLRETHVRLRELELPARLLATGFLLVLVAGFVVAHVNLHLQHAALDGDPSLTVTDVQYAFHGRPGSTLITTKISPGGSMYEYIPRPADRETIEQWVRDGAVEGAFPPVGQVLDRLCVRCHSPGGKMPGVPLAASRSGGAEFELAKPLTAPDTGVSRLALARSSHAHLFGMGMLFAASGAVVLFSDLRPRAKAVLVTVPFVFVLLDVGGWWLTKFDPAAAPVVVAAGGGLTLAAACQFGRSLWELWTPRRP